MEYSNESGITAYTYGNERLSYETNGVNYKYNYDGRGSVTNLLDNSNTSVVEYNYQPFGETEILGAKANELENTYQFNAESTDAITGLQYLIQTKTWRVYERKKQQQNKKSNNHNNNTNINMSNDIFRNKNNRMDK